MSPTAKAIAYGVVSIVAFIITAACATRVLLSGPTGSHASEGAPDDKHAPTLGDALAWQIRERLADAWTRLLALAGDVAHWHPWRSLQVRLWARQLRRDWRLRPAVRDLRGCVADHASPDQAGTVPATRPGTVPLDVRITASGGFPAVGIRPGKQPWETAGQPRLPEMLP